MIIDQAKLKIAIIQSLEEINDACFDLRQQGVGVLLPEFIDFEVQLVTDINAVERKAVKVSDGTKDDTTSSTKASTSSSTSLSTTTIDHPGVRTTQGGSDSNREKVTIKYKQ